MSDEDDKIQRLSLGNLENTGEVLRQANEAVVVHELRRALQRQVERDLVIEDIKNVLEALSKSHLLAVEKIAQLERAQSVLVKQQQEMYERQDIISAVCDAITAQLEVKNKAIERLAEDVADRD